jgi:Protein of unknown function (DUF1631)
MANGSSIEAAMQASRNSQARSLEARYRVADTIAEEILARPDAAVVPDDVLEFLTGPWAQVVAQARISNRRGVSDADGFAALIPVLIWSVQPELARKNQPMLVRQVPKLVAKLREGLATIQFPEHESFGFFELLMGLHEQGLRSDAAASATFSAMLDPSTQPAEFRPDQFQPDEFQSDPFFADSVQQDSRLPDSMLPDSMLPDSVLSDSILPGSLLPDSGQPASMLSDVSGRDAPAESRGELPLDARLPVPAPNTVPAVGAWVELRSDGEWKPTQLTWANPAGTLFLFTSASGSTQSMTRRSLDKLLASGKMRAGPG